MLRPRAILAVSTVLVACGGAAPTAPTTPTTAVPASAAPASSAPVECLAVVITRKPTAPNEQVGSITMRLATKAGSSCSMELRRGVVPVQPAPTCGATKDEYMKSAGDAACSIGGEVLFLTNADAEKTGVAELAVLRYTQPDPKADLAQICAPFSAIKNPRTGKAIDEKDIDPSQKARIRAQWLEETMTSPEWRGWLAHFPSDKPAAVAKLRERVKAAGLTCDAEWLKD